MTTNSAGNTSTHTPPAPVELEALIADLKLATAEEAEWRACAQKILAFSAGAQPSPKHVDAAIEQAFAAGASPAAITRLREVGRVLMASSHRVQPQHTHSKTSSVDRHDGGQPTASNRALAITLIGTAAIVLVLVIHSQLKKPEPPRSGNQSTAFDSTAARTPTPGDDRRPLKIPRYSRDLRQVNAADPGQIIDLPSHTVPGKTTLFEFYSDHCPPCREMDRVMEYLAIHQENLAIRKVDIDRPGFDGIDFDSPVAEQYEIHAVPAFRVYGPTGVLLAQDETARAMVRQWYNDCQLAERAAQHPEISAPYRKSQ